MTRIGAIGAAVVLFATGVFVRDLEAIAIAVLLVVGVLLLGVRRGLIGRIALGLLFADVMFWMAPAAWVSILDRTSFICLAVPLVLVIFCLAGTLGLLRVPTRAAAIASVALLAVGLAAPPLVGDSEDIPGPGEATRVSSRGASFSMSQLTAVGPEVTLVLHNKDLFWHTLTIDKLDVNLRAPLGAKRVARFNASPGTYKFYCAIPGHEAAGMKGTLRVVWPE
ncbi:MAG: hypothetical protein QOF21_1086 [Actinomycetota bacterium]|jgi:plastocyanin